MFIRTLARLTTLWLFILILASVASALAAANTVPATRMSNIIAQNPITPNNLKPPECATLNLTTLVVGSGKFSGGGGNSLILGSPGADQINGQNGNDCILGGGGNDDIAGGPGTDVCIGGPETDTFNQCETMIQ